MDKLLLIGSVLLASASILVTLDPVGTQIGAGYQNEITGVTYTQSFPNNGGR
jgi:hypothetical protein